MDNKRLLLFAALFMTLFMIWSTWQAEHPPVPTVSTSVSAPINDVPTAPSAPTNNATKETASPAGGTPVRGERIQIETDLLFAALDTNGGDLRELLLRKHPVSVDKPDVPFPLMNDKGEVFVARSGLIGGENLPTHRTHFVAQKLKYVLDDQQNELRVPLFYVAADGVRYLKTYIFRRGSYVIDVEFEIDNASKREWNGALYADFRRTAAKSPGLFGGVSTYTGPALYTLENRYEKISFDDIAKSTCKVVQDNTEKLEPGCFGVGTAGGWSAMLQHYFVGVWLPETGKPVVLLGNALEHPDFRFGYKQKELTTIAPGKRGLISTRLYAGPKEHRRLERLACRDGDLSVDVCAENERTRAPGAELTVDYGRLTVVSAPLFQLLTLIHRWIGNWGWSIVVLTILVKLAFYPLSAMSYKSMAKMRKVAPKMEALKQQHANDRTQLNQAMMELYKTEKVNPFGGCLPILIQIPVFFALYSVLLESVEMRQAPWMLWIHDLSTKDPYFVLPIIMGGTMYLQQKLSPQPPDPIQRKMFLFMPLIFTVMMALFPAGLVLYWTVNNALSILQQWRINTLIDGKKTK